MLEATGDSLGEKDREPPCGEGEQQRRSISPYEFKIWQPKVTAMVPTADTAARLLPETRACGKDGELGWRFILLDVPFEMRAGGADFAFGLAVGCDKAGKATAVHAVDLMPDTLGFEKADTTNSREPEPAFPNLPDRVRAFGFGESRFHWVFSGPAAAVTGRRHARALLQVPFGCRTIDITPGGTTVSHASTSSCTKSILVDLPSPREGERPCPDSGR